MWLSMIRDTVDLLRACGAYGNGEGTPGGSTGMIWSRTTDSDEKYAAAAAEWVSVGARIIGGCCGTRPETIRSVIRNINSPG